MESLFNFLSPEHGRLIIQGFRMGIAAHVVYLVAEMISRVKFCQVGTKGRAMNGGPSESISTIDFYAQAMDHLRVGPSEGLPPLYEAAGDSIALADLLASFFLVVPESCVSQQEMDRIQVDAFNFWSGAWKMDGAKGLTRENGLVVKHRELHELYTLFVREEGRYAVTRYAKQIKSALLSMGLLYREGQGPSSVFDYRLNRYLVNEENFCLNEEGRALLSALLTMHSSRVGRFSPRPGHQMDEEQLPAYCIHRVSSSDENDAIEYVYPEAVYTQPQTIFVEPAPIYGRFTDAFGRGSGYTGLVDPITLRQMAFFLNL
ncbi:hypothetical protein PFISCL1PPCAC_22328, partial [Pristionchus fissidentatus]